MSAKINKIDNKNHNHNDYHNTKKFLVKFHNNLYDLTKFIEKHPGGVNTLNYIKNGDDITKKFLNGPPSHSDAAKYLINEYRIHNYTNINENVDDNDDDGDDDDNEIKILNNNKQNYHNENKKITNNDYQYDYKKMNVFNLKNENFNRNLKTSNEEFIQYDTNNQLIDDSMEHLVDWSKPMISQIHKIKNQYNEWVNKPVDRSLRLFKSQYLEIFTKTPWWIVPLFWMPIILFLIHNEYHLYNIKNIQQTDRVNKVLTLLLYFIYGILIWTFVEYSLHRWIFHMKISEKHLWICTFHFMLHGLHHKVPFDPHRLVFPPLPAVIVALLFYPFVYKISVNPQITMAGGLFGYLCYDMIHYYLHYGNPRIKHLYQMKRYHYQHHFVYHELGFGISSPIWDIVFNTKIYLRKLKHVIQWKL